MFMGSISIAVAPPLAISSHPPLLAAATTLFPRLEETHAPNA
jgi:hypothetical protein